MRQRAQEPWGGCGARIVRWSVAGLLACGVGLAPGGCGSDQDVALQPPATDDDDDDDDDNRPSKLPWESEIAYDDGTPDEALLPPGLHAGSQVAVRFTPTRYPVEFVSVSFFVLDEGNPGADFGVRLYDDNGLGGSPGKLLGVFPNAHRRSHIDPWVEVSMKKVIPQLTEGDFFVAMVWLSEPGKDGQRTQLLGADGSKPHQRTWTRETGDAEWTHAERLRKHVADRDAMIRVRVR